MSSSNERLDADLKRFAAQFPSLHQPADCVACVRQMVAIFRCIIADDGHGDSGQGDSGTIAQGSGDLPSPGRAPVPAERIPEGAPVSVDGEHTTDLRGSLLFVERLLQLFSRLTETEPALHVGEERNVDSLQAPSGL